MALLHIIFLDLICPFFQTLNLPHSRLVLRQGQIITTDTKNVYLYSLFPAKLRQIFTLSFLPCNSFILIPALCLIKSHLLQRLRQTVPCLHAGLVSVRHRDIIHMQMRCCLVHVQHTVEQIQGRISLLKRLCIFFKNLRRLYGFFCHAAIFICNCCIIFRADLHHILIKYFLFIFGISDLRDIVMLLSVFSFLPGIVVI